MTADHHDTDAFRGATFRRVDLAGASLREVDLSGATIRDSDVRGLRIVASMVDDVVINGHEGVGRVVVDDVEVTAYVTAELDRRHPERVLVREMRSADDVRAAWAVVDGHVGRRRRARRHACPSRCSNERVEGEWSFLETVRHLVFADDIWVGRMLSDEPGPFHPLGVPPTDTTEDAAAEMGLTLDATPVVRRGRGPAPRAPPRVHRPLLRVKDADLPPGAHRRARPGLGRGVVPGAWSACTVVVREHAEHLRFALRDLAVLEAR